MSQKTEIYIPYVFRNFQGFSVKDIKEFIKDKKMEIVLEKNENKTQICGKCSSILGNLNSRYLVKARHLRVCNWSLSICFWREKRFCPNCKKVRSEMIEWLSPTSPHVTLELAWWLTRMSEITSVHQVSKLESVDKMTCYKVDKYILQRLYQGYSIPKVTHISVDEVYARGPKQKKKGENRDDLFLTVIVDLRTKKVIWVSDSRRKEALDDFFMALGSSGCRDVQVVATDQHESYSASVKDYCPQAKIVWDRFHLVQNFNDRVNEERKSELDNIDPEGQMGDLMNGKYRYIFLTKKKNRKDKDQRHINEVMRLNGKMAQLEIIKEHFHKMFDCMDEMEAQVMLCECYEWSWQAKAMGIVKWIRSIMDDERFWNYFTYRVTTGVSEGINRSIKGLKWQAYGYKDMLYFKLKILQKVGYLNHRYIAFEC